jgi:hypothetical protein
MSSLPSHNIVAFDLAQSQLESLGFEVVNPAQIGRELGYTEASNVTAEDLKMLLLADLEALAQCNAIYLLPGYEHSGGADIEVRAGRYWGIPAFESLSDLLVFREGKVA